MNYAKFIDCDLVNGKGVRCTLFVSGCSWGCKGCYNSSTWNPKSGHPVTEELIEHILNVLQNRHGLSLSGGDPLHPRNRADVTDLCRRAKERYPDKDIWLWTGYQAESLEGEEILRYVDVLIDGKYDSSQPCTKAFRGSDNQRMFRVENSKLICID